MPSRRAALIRAAQDVATQYSLPTRHLLETLVREVSADQAERVLELVHRIDNEAALRGAPEPPHGRAGHAPEHGS